MHANFIYGFVDHMPASLIKMRRFSFSWATMNSAKSSGCITFSGLPSVRLLFMARGVATVLGVRAVALLVLSV